MTDALLSSQSNLPAKQEIAFIDTSVAGYQTLLDGLKPGVEVALIDGTRDGLGQIADALAGRSDIGAVHLFSHGSAGVLELGSTLLTIGNMADYAADLAVIRAALAPGADFMVYGCDVAAGAGGQAFIDALSAATGADVAASIDVTGGALLGGNWVLESQAGPVETSVALTDYGQHNFAGKLAVSSINFDSAGTIDNFGVPIKVAGWTFDSGNSESIVTSSYEYADFGLNMDGGAGDRAIYLNASWDPVSHFTIGSTDSSHFKMVSLMIGVPGWSPTTVTITARVGNTTVGVPETFSLSSSHSSSNISYTMVSSGGPALYEPYGPYGLLTFSSTYSDINSISFDFGSDAGLQLDDIVVGTAVPADTTAPLFSSATVNGAQLVMSYTDANGLDAAHAPDKSSFVVTVGGSQVAVNAVAVDAAGTVTLTLAAAAQNGQAVTVAYNDPTAGNDANAIQDPAGNDAASLGVTAVTNNTPDTTPPTVASVTLPADGVYKSAVYVYFTVNFSENVVASTSTLLNLTVGSTAKTAQFYTGSGNTVTYRYLVQSGDADTDGISIDSISLNGGAIRDAAGNDAVLTLTGHVPSTTGILVDGVLPTLSGLIGVPADGTYGVGQKLSFTLPFSEDITVIGTNSRLNLTIGSTIRFAVYESKTANSITYSYTVQSGDLDGDGIAITSFSTGTSIIRDIVGNPANVVLAGHLPSTTGILVDAVAPSITGNIGAPVDGSYHAGQVLSFTATFNENLIVSGSDSTLALTIGSTARTAAFASSTANSVTYTYTVQAGDNDGDGIAVGAISLGTSTIRDATGNSANLTLTGHLPSTAGILVDTIAPSITGNIGVPSNATYIAGQYLDFTVTFDENVTVAGTDSALAITVGSASRSAAFLSSSGNTITYRYTVQAGDLDTDGISVGAISLGASTIRDAAGNDAAVTLTGNVPTTTGVLVDAVAPAVSGTIGVPASATYVAGQILSFTVAFDENVIVTGTDSTLGLTIGSTPRSATFASKTATSITYTYTVQAGDLDGDGISVGSISTGATTIRDAAGNNASLSLSGHLPATAGVLVDAVAPSITGSIGMPANGSYHAGQALSFTLTFDENVTVTGSDSTLALVIGSTARNATFVSSTTNSLTYAYTVQPGDTDGDGITVGAVSLGASTIRDAAGNNASLSLSGHVPSTAGILIDTTAPAVAGTLNVPSNGAYVAGQNLDFTVTFDESVTVTGSDSALALTIGATVRNAAFLSSSGNAITYRYTVQAGDLDADGISVGTLSLGTSTIRDAAGNDATLTLTGHLPSTSAIVVDAVAPSVSGLLGVPANATYVAGQALSFTVTFDENVVVNGTDSTLGLTVGSTPRYATFASKTANSITYAYTVQAGDLDGDGITVGSISQGFTTIRDAAGNNASLTLTGHVPPTTGVLVDAIPPAITGTVGVPANGSYHAGQTQNFTVTFGENIVVNGTDSTLALTIGSTARNATFASSTANSVTYTYTVQAGDSDADGITVGTIALGTSTIRDAAGNNANLSLSGHVPSTAGILVDTIAPTISGAISVPGIATYAAGQPLDFTVTFDESLAITGSDSSLALTIGAAARTAAFLSSTSNSITYRYTVQAGDLDTDSISVGAISLGTTVIRDRADNNADLTMAGHVPSTTGILVDAVAPSVSGLLGAPANATYVAGQTLSFTVTFDENVVVNGTDSTLDLTIGSTARNATFASRTANSITYVYTVQAGDLDGDGITVGTISPGFTAIHDAAGNNASLALAGHVPPTTGVLVDAVPPVITATVGVPANGSYHAGQTLSFTVTFGENITVSGIDSTLGLTIGSTARNATFASSTANSVTYTYTVQAGDNDTDGIAVGAISLGTSTIRDAAGNNAGLSLSGHIPSTTGILVDTTAPSVAAISAPLNAVYVAGQQLDFTVTFDENVAVAGTDSALALTIGSTVRSAVFLSSSGNTITYRYTVQAGDLDADGISVGAISRGASTIRDSAGNDANLALGGHLPSTSGILVDTIAPSITGNVGVPVAGTYVASQALSFTVTFDENVIVNSTDSTLGLTIGSTTRTATFASKTATSVTYSYTVQAGDLDVDGITVGSISLGATTIRDAAGNNASVSLSGHLPSTAAVLVDAVAPSVTGSIGVPANGSYHPGQALSFTVTFDENVIVSGSDSTLGLTIGSTARSATFASSTTNSLTYTYTVQPGDSDADGIAVGAISLGTSTIRDAAGNNAVLSMSGHIPSTSGILLDTTAPSVAAVSVPSNAIYVAGQQLDFTVTFDENVAVAGTDSTLALTIGSTVHSAAFVSSSGNTITYRYTVQGGDLDADGISVGAISVGTSTIRDGAGNDAKLTLAGHLPSTTGILVDTIAPAVTGNISAPASATYVAGQTLNFTVAFDENIAVNGTDSTLGLTIGSTARSATFASSTANSITYKYTVQAGDLDADGVGIGAISLGASTIRDAAGNNANVGLTGHQPAAAGVLVDAVAPSIAGNIRMPAAGTYVAGHTLSFTVTFDENVAVAGTDSTLGLTIGSAARSATFASSTANSVTYAYVVQAGDLDGVSVGSISLGTTTIRDNAGNNANVSLFGHVPATGAVLVDAVAPAVAGSIDVPANGSYRAGQTLSFTVTFDEGVTVTGSDSALGLTIGSSARSAAFASSTTNSVTYKYTVQAGDLDADGISLGAIALGASTIRDAAGNNATLSLTGHLPSTTGVLVDAIAPSVTGNIAVPANGSYHAGQVLGFTVAFDENVTVTGTDSTLALTIGSTARSAVFASSTANSVTYRYTVQAGDLDGDGISIGAIALGSSTIRDGAGNDAGLALTGHMPSTAGILVDTIAPAVSGNIGVPAAGTYVAGQVLNFTVSFDENVIVSGIDSTLGLTIGSTLRQASYASSSGKSVTYTYIVQPGDSDIDGITVGAISLGTSTIRDAAGNNALLTLGGHVPATTGVLVDTIAPVFLDATVNGHVLVMRYADDAQLDAAHLPATSAFTVNVGGQVVGVNAVAIDAAAHTVTLSLGWEVGQGAQVTVAYRDPSGSNDANAIQDAVGNDAASLAAASVVNKTPPPDAPPVEIHQVDGVAVGVSSVANDDGSTSQTVSVPIVTAGRVEQLGSAGTADIALASDGGKALLTVQAPVGIGFDATGSAAALPSGTASNELQRAIAAHTVGGSHEYTTVSGAGSAFIGNMPANAALVVESIAPTAQAGGASSTDHLAINGTPAGGGNPLTAIVLDGRGLAAGTHVDLNNIGFAAVMGAVTVTGGAGQQNIWGDSAAQTVVLGSGGGAVHAGGGNDILVGGAGSNQLFGDDGDDVLVSGSGQNLIDGGTGHDTVVLSGANRSDYKLRVVDGKLVMTAAHSGIDGSSVVSNVEAMKFASTAADTSAYGTTVRLVEALTGGQANVQTLDAMTAAARGGASLSDIARNLYAQSGDAAMGNGAYVQALYQNGLHRDASPAELSYWTGKLDTGTSRADLALSLANSQEKLASGTVTDFNQSDVAVLVRLYGALFDRTPDEAGLNYWIGAHENGMSISAIADVFVGTTEGSGIYGSMSNAQFVNSLYATAMHRQPAAAETQWWADALSSGRIHRGDVLLAFSEAPEHVALVGVISTSVPAA